MLNAEMTTAEKLVLSDRIVKALRVIRKQTLIAQDADDETTAVFGVLSEEKIFTSKLVSRQ